MAKTISNVLTGVATLEVRQPNDARAEWSTVQQYVGAHSAKLTKTGSGNAGSTHVEFNVASRGITMTLWTAGIITNSFFHHCSAVTGNFAQFEFRFEDPDSDAWVEITAVPLQTYLGTNAWVQTTLADADNSGYGGVDEVGLSISNWVLAALNGHQGIIEGVTTDGDCANWILSRIRLELWEATPARVCYIDSVEIMGTTYAIEPGDTTTEALSLSSPFTEVGYTEDGVTVTYTADTAGIEVEEETFEIDRVITKETAEVTCNMAESSLFNIDKAMAGAVLSGSILTLGAGVNKKLNLKIEGKTPSGHLAAIMMPLVTATGSVGMAYKKGEKTVVPVTFQALKPSGEPAVTLVYNAA